MKIKSNFILILSFLAFVSFQSCDDENQEKSNPLILNCWTHSFEESESNEPDVYRPCDYKEFSISWYRNSFTLFEDETCEFLVLAPNDAHYFVQGTWELNESNQNLTLYNLDGELLLQSKILEIAEDNLVLEAL